MAHKVTTMGFIAWANNHSDTDSTMVSILRSAGAVFYCRNNMPQTGMLLETWNNLFGRTLNPRNTNFSAGGSSGGDAALLALRGAPICPSSDIGGSIRAPAAFNGLYGIRPTADRVPKTGMTTSAPGNVSIKVSCGPNCHSMADIKLLTELILTHASIPFEPTCINVPWRTISKPTHKLSFGILMTDNVVDPHPPIKRALLETAAKLTAQGHEVFEFNPPFDFWEAALITWKLYFQTGAAETKKLVSDAGEPLSPVFQHYLKTYNIKPLTVPELFATNTKQAGYKLQFAQAWTNTQSATSTGRPMDGLICPAGPCAGFPHDFPIWWGYFSIFNLLDYPSIIMPIKDMKIDPIKDAKDQDYRPRDNPFDAENWKICEFLLSLVLLWPHAMVRQRSRQRG
jgi:amidase